MPFQASAQRPIRVFTTNHSRVEKEGEKNCQPTRAHETAKNWLEPDPPEMAKSETPGSASQTGRGRRKLRLLRQLWLLRETASPSGDHRKLSQLLANGPVRQ